MTILNEVVSARPVLSLEVSIDEVSLRDRAIKEGDGAATSVREFRNAVSATLDSERARSVRDSNGALNPQSPIGWGEEVVSATHHWVEVLNQVTKILGTKPKHEIALFIMQSGMGRLDEETGKWRESKVIADCYKHLECEVDRGQVRSELITQLTEIEDACTRHEKALVQKKDELTALCRGGGDADLCGAGEQQLELEIAAFARIRTDAAGDRAAIANSK
jgi:hypothetical protein